MLWGIGVGARRQHAPRCHLGIRRPHLLAGDAPTVRRRVRRGCAARRDRIRPPARKSPGTRSRRPDGDGRQVLGLLFGGPVPHQRRTDPVDSHVLRTAGLVLGPHLLAQHRLLPDRTTAAAMLFRPGQRQQPLGGQQLAERLGGGQVLRIVGAGAEEVGGDVYWISAPAAAFAVRRRRRRGRNPSSSLRQPEQSLGDDVALDLRCAAVDGRGQRVLAFEQQIRVAGRMRPLRRPR